MLCVTLLFFISWNKLNMF